MAILNEDARRVLPSFERGFGIDIKLSWYTVFRGLFLCFFSSYLFCSGFFSLLFFLCFMNISQWVKHTTEYNNYLLSKEWRDKRIKILQTRNCCECCKSQKILQIHHLHYRNIFCEDLDKDLVVLCKKCHKIVHDWYDNRTDKYRSLEEVTRDIIQNYWIKKEKPVKKSKVRINRKEEKIYRFKKREVKQMNKKRDLTISDHQEINKMYREVLEFHKTKLKGMKPILRKNFEKKLFQMIRDGNTSFRN